MLSDIVRERGRGVVLLGALLGATGGESELSEDDDEEWL